MADHARLSPSSAHRWMLCPGAPRLEEQAPPDEGSEYAAEGTAAHALAEMCLRTDSWPCDHLGEEVEGFEVTKDMADAVTVYVRYVRGLPGACYIEELVSLEDLGLAEDIFGTVDFGSWEPEGRTLYVVDYKHGAGVVVDVADNPQTLCYILGLVLKLRVRPERIVAAIVQPRAYRDNAIDEVEYTWDDLLAFKDELVWAVQAVQEPDAAVGPVGDHCKWCRAKAFCPAQQSNALTVAQDTFAAEMPDDTTDIAPEALTTEQLALVLERAPQVEDWLKAVREYARTLLEAGEEVPGWKLVAKRASRRWADEAEAEAWFRQRYPVKDVYTQKLLSPAQAEKLLKDRPRLRVPDGMIVSSSSGTNLAPADSPKPAITPGSEFTTILDEENLQ